MSNTVYNDQNSISFLFQDYTALTHEQLDQQRGGFIDKSGFKISLGFEKVVVVNGQLQTQSRFYIPEIDLTSRNKHQMQDLATAMEALHERLNNPNNTNDITGNHSQSELTETADEVGNIADNINNLTTNTSNKNSPLTPSSTSIVPSTVSSPTTNKPGMSPNLTTSQRTGEGDYTDALLSMLNGSQSTIESAASELVEDSHSATISDDILVNSGSHNAITSAPSPSNSMSTVVMNSQDSALIQSFQMLNIRIDNLGAYRSKSINGLVLPQIIHSLR